MNPILKAPLRGALDAVPASLWQWVFPKDVIALMYHMVSDADVPHLKYYPYKNTAQFEADVAYARERYHLLSYDELVRCRRRSGHPSPNGMLFTFDDGFAECFTAARPILRKHNAGGVFFVTTDFIDSRASCFELRVSLCVDAAENLPTATAGMLATELAAAFGSQPQPETAPASAAVQYPRIRPGLSHEQTRLIGWLLHLGKDDGAALDVACERLAVDWAAYFRQHPPYMTSTQLRQLAAEGFIVGAHSLTHGKLQTMPREELERDIVESCDIVRQLTGQRRVPFAFPYTGHGISRAVLSDVLQRHDFIELFFDSGGLRTDVPFVVDRVWADLPMGCIGNRTNLPSLLRDQWSRRDAWTRSPFRLPALPPWTVEARLQRQA